MSIFSLDFVVLVSYFAAMIGIGLYLSRRSCNTEEFMAAGRSLPAWAVGFSIFGTFLSSISFLANPGKSYASNWNAFVFGLPLPIAALVAARYFVPFFRRSGEVSAYSHLEHRFGLWARTYAVACYFLTQTARMGAIMYLMAVALHPLTGWNLSAIIIVTGVIATAYTLLGGIEAVIWTDVVQSIVLLLGMAVCVAFIVFQMPQGPGEIFQIAWSNDKFSLGSLSADLTTSTFWIVFVFGLVSNLQNFGIDQGYVQRYITARSDAEARRSVWLGAMLYLPASAALFFIGTALFAFYRIYPERLAAGGAAAEHPDGVFPHFIVTELPPGVTGLLIAAILAAAMSTIDTSMNSSATLVLCDIYKRWIRPRAGERESMAVLYLSTLFWGAVGTGAAIALIPFANKNLLDIWWTLASFFSGGMLGLFLLGMLCPWVGSRSAAVGVVAGVACLLWMSITKLAVWPAWLEAWGLEWLVPYSNPLHDNLAIVLGTAVIFVVGMLAGVAIKGRAGKEDLP